MQSNIIRDVSLCLERAFTKSFPDSHIHAHQIYRILTETPDISLGHFAFAPFPFTKACGKNPTAIAAALFDTIDKDAFANVGIQGPYINFTPKQTDYYDKVIRPICDGSFFQPLPPKANPKTMFEYSQPNTHKTLHVGHMRNLCLGNALVQIHRYLGRDVLAVTYPGDVGTHVAKCLWYMKYHNDQSPPEEEKGAWLGELYAKAHDLLENERGGKKEEQNRAELSEILKQLHDGKGEFFDLWKTTRQWSLELMKQAYSWADVYFDHWFFESQMDAPSISLAKKLLDEGILTKDRGAVGIDLKEENLGFCLLIKSDGTGLYATKDVLLATKKFQEFGIEKNIYIVDNRQSLHFKQVFKTLEKMGFAQAKVCLHLQYDVVELPEGAMSSRKGNIVPLMDLIRTMEAKVRNDYLEKYISDWPDEEIEETARVIADGAIKYGMISIDPNRKIVFHMDRWTKLDGNTGPYLQYVYARITSLCKKYHFDPKQKPDFNLLSQEQECAILVKLSLFNDIVAKAGAEFKTPLVCSYLFDLGKLFNNFYAACPIGKAKNKALSLARLHIAYAVGAVMKQGLSTLGIKTPKRM